MTVPKIIINGPAWAGMNYLFAILAKTFPHFDIAISADTSKNISGWHYTITHFRYEHLLSWFDCLLNDSFKDKKYIFITRDPRDVIISGARRENGSVVSHMQDGKTSGWFPLNHSVEDLRFFFSNRDFYQVKYEQLAFKPVETLTNLINFMGYPLDMAAIENAVQTIPRTGKVGQWVNFFDDEIEATFKELGGDIVSYLGYEPDENWSYKEYQGKENMTEEEYWNMKPRLLGI